MSSTSRSSGEGSTLHSEVKCSGDDANAAAAADDDDKAVLVAAATWAFSMSTSEAIFVGFDFFRRFFDDEDDAEVEGVRENGVEF